jgi:hypothetical protein
MRMAASVARSGIPAVVAAAAAAASVLALAGCPYVADGEIRVTSGSTTIGPGSQVTLALYCDRLFAGWELAAGGESCAGAWRVADPAAGAITPCGVYTAPAERPATPPIVEAIECDAFECADACGASLTLELSGYDAR